jgi:DNA polymerase V
MQVRDDGLAFPMLGEFYYFVRLDLSRALIKNPASTFFVQLTEDAMLGAGLSPGDILVVDRAAQARHNDIIIACVEGAFMARRLQWGNEGIALWAEHSDYPPIAIEADTIFQVWGVVRDVIKADEI